MTKPASVQIWREAAKRLQAEVDRLRAEAQWLREKNAELSTERNLLVSEANMLRAENEALRRDAERYRWLRTVRDSTDDGIIDVALWKDCQGTGLRMDTLDDAIDAAMKENKT